MEKRYSYSFAMEEYRKLEIYLRERGYRCEPSGSLRRKKEDVGDIDFLVEGDEDTVLAAVESYPQIIKRINWYEFQLESGICIHAIPEKDEMYNYTLWQSTGPKSHVRWVKECYRRKGAQLKRLRIEEGDIYSGIDMPYIEPENRYRYTGEEDDQEG